MSYDYDYYEKQKMVYPSADSLFFGRVIPTIVLGLAVWVFGIIIIGPDLLVNNPSIFFIGIFAYIIMWIATIIIAAKGSNEAAFVLFLGTSAVSGVLTTPLFVWGAMMVGLELGFQIGIISIAAALTGTTVMGFAGYRNRHNQELAASLGSFLFWGVIATIIFEVVAFFIFAANYSFIFFITSIIMIWLMLIYAFYDGQRLRSMLDNGLWMYAVAMFFIDIIILTTRIFYVLIYLIAGDR
ncbi:MAG: Bax inhibitor-1 family protein [Candidatus Odinarchaeota archaeon]